MNPEEKAEIIIWDWLRPKVKQIYFNRVNLIGAPTFKTKGSRKIPDFVIELNDGKYIVIEIKPSNEAAKLQRAEHQLINRYYLPYINNEIKYIINGNEIKINHFLLATENSKFGKLFHKREYKINNLTEGDKHREHCVKIGTIPKYEYSRTCDLVRGIWANLREYREKNEMLKKPGLGILTNHWETKEPMMFTMCYTKKWGQHYWPL